MKKFKLFVLMMLFFVGISGVRADAGNNYLSKLEISEANINFDKDNVRYKAVVLYDVSSLTIDAQTEDSNAKYEVIGNENFVVGNNEVIVKVTAENGKEKEYKITVVRKDVNETISSNSDLTYLVADKYHLNFKKGVYEYTLNIAKDAGHLVFNYGLADPNSKVDFYGNYNLQDKSVVTAIVTAEDGSTSTYKINIVKGHPTILIYVVIGGGALLLGLLIFVIVFAIRSKKKKKVMNNNPVNPNPGAVQPVPSAPVNMVNQDVNSMNNQNTMGVVQPIPQPVQPTPIITTPNVNPVVTPVQPVQPQPVPGVVENVTPSVVPNAQVVGVVTPQPVVSNPGVVQPVPSAPVAPVANGQVVTPAATILTPPVVGVTQNINTSDNLNVNNNQ